MDKILILDFGGQYNQLIAKRIRNLGVYAEIKSYNGICINNIKEQYKGIVFTGGPNSVYLDKSPKIDKKILNTHIPILGICYGCQLIAYLDGGNVVPTNVSEYGKTSICFNKKSTLCKNMQKNDIVWMSHNDIIKNIPTGYKITASTENCPIAAMENTKKNIYAVQFHPEVEHTINGNEIFKSFLFDVCKLKKTWKIDTFLENSINNIKNKIGNKKAICALSGGVDSSVAAILTSKAIGKNLTCVFVDHGLLRYNEAQEVEKTFGPNGQYELNFIKVDARKRFLEKLDGVIDPEKKRKIIGEEFIKVFEQKAKLIGNVDYLIQGTIYPDIIESGCNQSATIKSHHNVGGLPDVIDFKQIIEPLKYLFKDEVRKVGLSLNIPKSLINRQPFPGPGLGIRIIGKITEDKIRIVQHADYIYRNIIEEYAEEYKQENGVLPKWMPKQYFAALSNMKSVGVMGDHRSYDYAIVLRAVITNDFMTAESSNIPYILLNKVCNQIINEVKGVNRVLYDITSKPPGTIEFE